MPLYPPLSILTYHRIGDDNDFVSRTMGAGVPLRDFARQMEFLAKHCHVVTLGDALRLAAAGEKGPLVVVTFDDGYRDNHTHAWPVLKEYKIPATIFLVADHVGSEMLVWQHRLYYLKDTKGPEWVAQAAGARDFSGAMQSFRGRGDLEPRDALIDEFWKKAGCDAAMENRLAKNLYLDWEQVRAMSAGGIEFGSHSRTHPCLSSVQGETLRNEVAGSKADLQQKLGKPVDTFCYTYGDEKAINTEVVEAVRKAGYLGACTTSWGTNRLAAFDGNYLLKRKGMNYSRSWEMWLEISGLKDLLRRCAGR